MWLPHHVELVSAVEHGEFSYTFTYVLLHFLPLSQGHSAVLCIIMALRILPSLVTPGVCETLKLWSLCKPSDSFWLPR